MSCLGRIGRIGASRWQAWAAGIMALALACNVASANGDHHPMRFDRVSLDEGLSQSNVLAILQDSSGLMWFGTENGLNSYNGYEFEYFTRERGNPDALGSDFIYDLAEDADGNLWIATNGGGLAKLDRNTRRFQSFRHQAGISSSPSSNVIRTLLIDADGTMWLGTRGAGLDKLGPDGQKLANYRLGSEAHTKSADEIHVLYRDTAGTLWIGSNRGLSRLDTALGELYTYTHDVNDAGSLSDHRVRSILEDSQGELWVGTYGGGLNRFNRESDSFERFRHESNDPSSIASDRVTSIFEDIDGRLWVGTSRGLNLVNRSAGTFIRYANDTADPSSLGDDAVTQIYQDRGGMLWVGTQNRGLSKWNPRTWAYGFDNARKLTADGEGQPNVTAFLEDEAGTLWLGTFGDGLNAVDRESGDISRYRSNASGADRISDDRVMSLAQGQNGDIWVGTMTGGLNQLNPQTGENRIYRHDPENPQSLSSDGIMTVMQDSGGLVWVGTFGGGISRLDPQTGVFTRFLADTDNSRSLGSDRVTSFAEDSTGKIWVGTDAGGLNLFDPATGEFHQFRHDHNDPRALSADTVYAINVDINGDVWVGTQGGGLDRVVGGAATPEMIHFENLSRADGLSNDVIYGIQIDASGRVWLSTNYGINRFDPASGEIKNMHRRDGLQSEEFNFGAHYRSTSGELFFGGHNGFNAFQPDQIQASHVIPAIMLTGFYDGKSPIKSDLPTDEDGNIEISYRDDVISFEFAALDYASPAQNQYKYMLEGFDKEWIDLGNRRRVTYTDLNDGAYVLRVKAANSDGVWNESGYSIALTVTPAPWDTWWAYLSYCALFAVAMLSLWLGHRRKIRREEEYSQRLEEEVCERTDALAKRNHKLKRLNQSLQESSLSDPLTGLRNRRFVFEEVSRDLEVVRRKYGNEDRGMKSEDAADMVFMMIDLDNFKPINDTYGHAAGDEILLEVRNVLLKSCRDSDFVIRWGGDEFVVIAKQTHPGEAKALAEKIRRTIAERNFCLSDGQIVRTTCSIGFAAYPLYRGQADEGSLEQVINMADGLMYDAKRQRNAWAGLFGIADAAVSESIDLDAIESTSMLFRAKHKGNLTVHTETQEVAAEEYRNVG